MGTMKKSVQCVDDAKSGPHSFESYEDMMNKFINFNSICSYRWRKTQHQGKMYLEPEEFHIVMKSKRNLSWSSRGRKAKGVTLEFDGIPYVIIGREFFTCHQGPDVDRLQKAKKRKLEETKINQDPTYSIKRRTNFQTTKKKNCLATVEMLYIVKILNLKISKDNRWDRALAAQNFHTKYDWDFKHEYHIYLPSKMEHKGHPIIKEDCKYLSHLLKDSKVENNINIVVSKDYTNSYINQPHKGGPLESAIVESEEANVLLEVQNDEPSLEEKCKELTSDANYFVRENDNANGTNFLFVYQCHWQKRLLSLYGNEVCFVDAGHRTCNFSLRTFFLRVKTNVCHIVVGLFICEKEDIFSIKEALSKLSCWNEKWAPKNFLTDYATLKSQGISSVFPKSNVNLSDYYREKEWSEWLCQEENCLRDSSIEILKLVRAIARTTSVCSYEIAKKQLQQSSIWTESLVLQAYYNTVWQPVEDKWVQGFRDESKNILVLSKVGSEKENDWIKNSKLPDFCDLPVIRLFEVLVNEFFPESYKKYFDLNIRSSEGYRNYHESIPTFLHNRPRYLIEHIMKRVTSELQLSMNDIKTVLPNQFELRTQPGSHEFHSVFLGDDTTLPHCSCLDWNKHKLPCKHILWLITRFEGNGWDSLCPFYSKSPFFRLDDEVFLMRNENFSDICLENTDTKSKVNNWDGDYIITIFSKREVLTPTPISQRENVITKWNLILNRIQKVEDGEKLESLDAHFDDILAYLQENRINDCLNSV